MGLDQRLYWIGKPSNDMVRRFHRKTICECDSLFGMTYLSMEEYNEPKYKYIRKHMTSEEVYTNQINWDLIASDCGVSRDSQLCGLGPGYVVYEDIKDSKIRHKFNVNPYDERYTVVILGTYCFYLEDEVYRWRNNYDIQKLFNDRYPEVWDEYKQQNEMIYAGYYPIKGLTQKMKKVDPVFSERYSDGTDHIYYESDW